MNSFHFDSLKRLDRMGFESKYSSLLDHAIPTFASLTALKTVPLHRCAFASTCGAAQLLCRGVYCSGSGLDHR